MATKQSITVDYIVSVGFDGVTPAPEVVLGETRIDEDSQIYQVEVENLGLVDPDLGEGGSIGPRCITQISVFFNGITPPGGTLGIAVVLPDGSVQQVIDLTSFAGQPDAGTLRPIIVPQGAVLRFADVQAGPNPIVVRISIETPSDPCNIQALLAIADSASGDGDGDGDGDGAVMAAACECYLLDANAPQNIPEQRLYNNWPDAADAILATGRSATLVVRGSADVTRRPGEPASAWNFPAPVKIVGNPAGPRGSLVLSDTFVTVSNAVTFEDLAISKQTDGSTFFLVRGGDRLFFRFVDLSTVNGSAGTIFVADASFGLQIVGEGMTTDADPGSSVVFQSAANVDVELDSQSSLTTSTVLTPLNLTVNYELGAEVSLTQPVLGAVSTLNRTGNFGIDPTNFVGGVGPNLVSTLNRMAALLNVLNAGPIP